MKLTLPQKVFLDKEVLMESTLGYHNRPITLSLEEIADLLLSGNSLRILWLIEFYTRPSGFCDVDNKTLEQQFAGMNGNRFKYHLAILQRKGLLFKKLIPIPKRGGRRQILVVKKYWRTCHKYWVKKRHYKRAAELESYFTGLTVDFLLFTYSGK